MIHSFILQLTHAPIKMGHEISAFKEYTHQHLDKQTQGGTYVTMTVVLGWYYEREGNFSRKVGT